MFAMVCIAIGLQISGPKNGQFQSITVSQSLMLWRCWDVSLHQFIVPSVYM